MRLAALALVVVATATSGCDDDSGSAPEVVVADASLGGAAPVLLGASATAVFWSASSSGTSATVGAASLATLPAPGMQVATGSRPVAHAGDFAVLVAGGTISRVDSAGTIVRLVDGAPDMLAGGQAATPVIAWSTGPIVSWGPDDAQRTATLNRIDTCDHARVTPQQLYVACDGATGRRLFRIDQQTMDITPVTASSTWAPMFPSPGTAGSTYRGRVVDADDEGALWLVEERPSNRAILVHEPVQGDATVILEHVRDAAGFFASADALYWQEGDTLLTAPRTGGAASIVTTLAGPAGGFADGFVYFTNGTAIERVRVE